MTRSKRSFPVDQKDDNAQKKLKEISEKDKKDFNLFVKNRKAQKNAIPIKEEAIEIKKETEEILNARAEKEIELLTSKKKVVKNKSFNDEFFTSTEAFHVVTPEILRTCDFCGFKAPSKAILEAHLVHKHRKFSGQFSCNKCSEQFKKKEDLRSHKNIHAIRRSCCFCNLNFPRKQGLRRHIRFMHKEQNQQVIDDLVKEITNMKTWNDVSSNNDEINKKFKVVENVLKDDTYTCKICFKVSKSRKTLNSHMSRCHINPKKTRSCVICTKTFSRKTSMKNLNSCNRDVTLGDNESLKRIITRSKRPFEDDQLNQGSSSDINKQDDKAQKKLKEISEKDKKVFNLFVKNRKAQKNAIPIKEEPIEPEKESEGILNARAEAEIEILTRKENIVKNKPDMKKKEKLKKKRVCIRMCDICGFSIESKTILDYHMSAKHVRKTYTCRECEEVFDSKEDFDRHKSQHSKSIYRSCCYCDTSFCHKNSLIRHITMWHGLNQQEIDKLVELVYAMEWKDKTNENEGNKKFKIAENCSKPKRDKQSQQKEHLINRECFICKKMFSNRYTMVTHFRKKTLHKELTEGEKLWLIEKVNTIDWNNDKSWKF
ncbi:hypothetical protein PVAND_001267 [Polypedilum vanderplanki]|uniref:C2H2-type domain-containing protein n=1 Tax=Polypedilum vanderplanki TaxID=319348 RepID=A0A9J6BME7_POLVA|nr:hypothetical protein PVAND_001267 [Polypedilum vanderplanki]